MTEGANAYVEKTISKGAIMHADPIGPLGTPAFCPICKRPGLFWDAKTGVSTCSCGWNNKNEAEQNRQKRVANGEIKKEVKLK